MSIYYEARYFSNLFVQVNRLQVNNTNLLFFLQGISVSFKGYLVLSFGSTWINWLILTYFVTLWMISRSFQRPARALSSRWVPVGQSNFLARSIREFVWGEWVVAHSRGVSGISLRDMSRTFLNASLLSCVAFRTFLFIALNKRAPWKGKELNLRVWYRPVFFSGWIWVNDGFSVPSRPQRTRGKKQALEFFWRHLGCLNMIFLIANDVKHGGRTPQKWPICSILKVMRLESWKKCTFLIFFNFCRL